MFHRKYLQELESIYVEINRMPYGYNEINLNSKEIIDQDFTKPLSIKLNFEDYAKSERKTLDTILEKCAK